MVNLLPFKNSLYISDSGSSYDLHRVCDPEVKSKIDLKDVDTISQKSSDSGYFASIKGEAKLSSNLLLLNKSTSKVEKNYISSGALSLQTDQSEALKQSGQAKNFKEKFLIRNANDYYCPDNTEIDDKEGKRKQKGLKMERKLESIKEEIPPDPDPVPEICNKIIPETERDQLDDDIQSDADSNDLNSYEHKYPILQLFLELFGLNMDSDSFSQSDDSRRSFAESEISSEYTESEISSDESVISSENSNSNCHSEDKKRPDIFEFLRESSIADLKPGVHQKNLPYSVKVSKWQCLKENMKHQFSRIFVDQFGFMKDEIIRRRRTVFKGDYF